MWVYVVLYILAMSGLIFNVNKSDRTRKIYLAIMFTLILLTACLRKYTVGTDLYYYYARYFPRFANAEWSKLQSVTISGDWEYGFCAFCKILSTINPDIQMFIVFSSLISILPYCFFIYKNSEDVVFSTVFFIGYHIFMMNLNIVRQAMAVGILIMGFESLKKKEYLKFTLYVIVASLFHASAIIALVLIILDRLKYKKVTLYILALVTTLFALGYRMIFNYVISLTLFNGAYDIYGENGTGDTSGYITFHTVGMFLIALMIFLVGNIYLKNKNKNENKTMYVKKKGKRFQINNGILRRKKHSNANVINKPTEWSESLMMYSVYMATFFRFDAFIINVTARFALYFIPFLMISYPHSVKKMGNKSNKFIYSIGIYSLLTLFFFVILFQKAERLWGTVPYSFFWN